MTFAALTALLEVRNEISWLDTPFGSHQLPNFIGGIETSLSSWADVFFAGPFRFGRMGRPIFLTFATTCCHTHLGESPFDTLQFFEFSTLLGSSLYPLPIGLN